MFMLYSIHVCMVHTFATILINGETGEFDSTERGEKKTNRGVENEDTSSGEDSSTGEDSNNLAELAIAAGTCTSTASTGSRPSYLMPKPMSRRDFAPKEMCLFGCGREIPIGVDELRKHAREYCKILPPSRFDENGKKVVLTYFDDEMRENLHLYVIKNVLPLEDEEKKGKILKILKANRLKWDMEEKNLTDLGSKGS